MRLYVAGGERSLFLSVVFYAKSFFADFNRCSRAAEMFYERLKMRGLAVGYGNVARGERGKDKKTSPLNPVRRRFKWLFCRKKSGALYDNLRSARARNLRSGEVQKIRERRDFRLHRRIF